MADNDTGYKEKQIDGQITMAGDAVPERPKMAERNRQRRQAAEAFQRMKAPRDRHLRPPIPARSLFVVGELKNSSDW